MDATGTEHSLSGAVGVAPCRGHPRLRLQVPESHLRYLHLPQLKATSLRLLRRLHHLLLPQVWQAGGNGSGENSTP